MKTMKVKLFGSNAVEGYKYEDFSRNDRFEYHEVNHGVISQHWVIGINRAGRHRVDFYSSKEIAEAEVQRLNNDLMRLS